MASNAHDIMRIKLKGDGVMATFELHIEIASDEDMSEVEQAFFETHKIGDNLFVQSLVGCSTFIACVDDGERAKGDHEHVEFAGR